MDDREADLFADFVLARADCLNILLIERDAIEVPSAGRGRPSWSWARHGRDPEAAAVAAPNAVQKMAGAAACPQPEQQRYECDCEILGGASQALPRLP